VRKSRRRKTPAVKLSFGGTVDTKHTKGENIFINNIDVNSISSIDLWMVRFIIKCNKWYVVGILSPTNVQDIESLINEYKKYLHGGEKDKNGLTQKIKAFLRLIKFPQNKVIFGMITTKEKQPLELKRQVSGSVNSITQLSDDIFGDDDLLRQRAKALGVKGDLDSDASLQSRLKNMLNASESKKFSEKMERHDEMAEVLDSLGVLSPNEDMAKIQETFNQMNGSVQQILAGQQQTLSVVNTLSSTLTNTKSSVSQMMKNGIAVVAITSIKMGLKGAVFGFIGLPWIGAKGMASFAMTGGYHLFKPFIVLLSVMFFLMQCGNVFYVATIPTMDIYLPNQYSAVMSKYPLINKISDRMSLMDHFSRDVSRVNRVMDLSMIEYKHQTEAGKILSNMDKYTRIYHQSSPIPRLVYDELGLLKKMGGYYYFRGYHILIDIGTNYKRSYKGYERLLQDLSSSGKLVETFTSAAYQTQIEIWTKCNDMAGNLLGKVACGPKPIKNTDAFDRKDKTQKNYLKWKECGDYNSNLNMLTLPIYGKDCGKKPVVYSPLKDFITHNPETLWRTISSKLSLWLSEEEINKLKNNM
jgi:hypothetical protein